MLNTSQTVWASAHSDGVVLAIFVQPRASKNQLCGVQGEELKLRLTSPPVDGAANKLCCQFLAKLFGCAKSDVLLVAGHKSRHKKLLVTGVSCSEAVRLIAPLLN